jgi:2-polyprenyl-3-methyl-5-hydroxy-6-metoxy-1,4-benzoquinol methylase
MNVKGARMESTPCPFCRSGKTKFWFHHVSEQDGKSYPIYKCAACGSAFVHPSPTPEFLNEYYSSTVTAVRNINGESVSESFAQVLRQESEFPNATIDAERIAVNLKAVASGPKMLDVGAGCGFFSRAVTSLGFRVTAIELNEQSRAVFRLMNSFDALNVAFDEGFSTKHAGIFDVVLLTQVLEHIPMESKPVENIHKVLSPNGICAITVPHFRSSVSVLQGKKDMFIRPPEHLNFFTISGLDALFRANGFEAIKHETISRFDKSKLRAKIRPSIVADSIAKALTPFLSASDRFDRGMFIHSYFKKV